MAYDALVLGAGFSGLAAGIRLAMYGRRVAVLERHSLWGGLNSFYKRGGRLFDTGLHALTNCPPGGPKGTPLGRLLRQLRIPPARLSLVSGGPFEIVLGERRLGWRTGLEDFTESVAAAFPKRVDDFLRLHRELAALDVDRIEGPTRSARTWLEERTGDPHLADMLLMPCCYYTSAREGDVDFDQFAFLYQAIFCEGMALPRHGIRPFLKLFVDRLAEAGGELRRKCEVTGLLLDGERVRGVRLANGEEIEAPVVLSSAGRNETLHLAGASAAREHVGPADRARITVLETISVLDTPPHAIGDPRPGARPLRDAVVFFAAAERFDYRAPEELADTTHGVLSLPTNFGSPADWEGEEPTLRATLLAHPEHWHGLAEPDYLAAKQRFSDAALARVADLYSDPRPHEVFRDVFTPRTITKYTAHDRGALYGSPTKHRDGRTPFEGLVLIGADQGMCGIVGAGLSGVAMANRHGLGIAGPAGTQGATA